MEKTTYDKRIKRMACAAFCGLLLAGCAGDMEESRVDLADPIGGSSIVTAADFMAFLERGEGATATLSADISLENEMLRITKERDGLAIDGNGFTLSGAGDCVIRLDAGCSIFLNDITVHGGSDAIGCLGDASVGGSGARLIGVGNALRAEGVVTVLPQSSITAEANIGSGLVADGLFVEAGASLTAEGPMGGINISSGDIQVAGGALLAAYTEENYNALKCGGILTLEDGSKLVAENRGQYHGAEVTDLAVEGAVTIEAKGGETSSGLFLFEQREDITVVGSCSPKPRFESGKGSITFVESAGALPQGEGDAPEPAGGAG